jgi:hypothetical protein
VYASAVFVLVYPPLSDLCSHLVVITITITIVNSIVNTPLSDPIFGL